MDMDLITGTGKHGNGPDTGTGKYEDVPDHWNWKTWT
jgi:hypothetical protein